MMASPDIPQRRCAHLACTGAYCVATETELERHFAAPLLSVDELRNRLEVNPSFLENRVLSAFETIDKKRRGFIRTQDAARILHRLNAFSAPAAALAPLLEALIFTDDNFVVYKPLVTRVRGHPEPSHYDSLHDLNFPRALWPGEIFDPASHPASGSAAWTGETGDAVRRIYAMWERSIISEDRMAKHLELVNVPLTFEARCLIAARGPARDLPFADFVKALRIADVCPDRKNRSHFLPAPPRVRSVKPKPDGPPFGTDRDVPGESRRRP